MTVQSNFSAIRGVPVGQLFLAPENVRKGTSKRGIPELAHAIKLDGVLQNLVGYEDAPIRGKGRKEKAVGVVAGGRRWLALQWLLQEGEIRKDYIVPIIVTSKDAAVAISLAENSDRENLHPADEFEAARALVDAGQSIEDVSARLHLSVVTVQRRLKLANVSPEFIRMYRDGKLTLEHLMAFAVTDDHEKQRHIWTGLPIHGRTAYAIRGALTETEISSRDPIARFVTVKAYEKAGGQCRPDLFSEDDNIFLQDVDLLKRLAQQKLDKQAQKLKAEGLAWVDVSPRLDYAVRAAYGRVGTTTREPTKKERGKLEAFEHELAEVQAAEEKAGEDEDALAELDNRRAEIKEAREQLQESLAVPDPAQQAKAGALVCIDHDGKLQVETGLLRSADAKLFAASAKQQSTASGEVGSRNHSAALLLRLTAHRTQALRAVFAQSPEIALAAVVHRFILDTFSDCGTAPDSALTFATPEYPLQAFAKDLEGTPAHAWLDAQEKHLRSILPRDRQALFQWLLDQSYVEKLALLAFCAARSLNAVQNHEGESDADTLARALHMDLRQWWTPNAEGYFNCVPKAITLAAVKEGVSPEAAAKIEPLKKRALAEEAHKALAGKGWVPPFLRSAWIPADGSTAVTG
jgi:ParB family chromosome partitioning protein